MYLTKITKLYIICLYIYWLLCIYGDALNGEGEALKSGGETPKDMKRYVLKGNEKDLDELISVVTDNFWCVLTEIALQAYKNAF